MTCHEDTGAGADKNDENADEGAGQRWTGGYIPKGAKNIDTSC